MHSMRNNNMRSSYICAPAQRLCDAIVLVITAVAVHPSPVRLRAAVREVVQWVAKAAALACLLRGAARSCGFIWDCCCRRQPSPADLRKSQLREEAGLPDRCA